MTFRTLVLFALTVAIAVSIAVSSRAQSHGGTSDDQDLARGHDVYLPTCAPCHGPSGEGGRGPTLALPNLTNAPNMDALVKVIRSGISGTEMPRSRMSDADARQVATWVRLGSRPVERVSGDARCGEQLYLTKGACAACHTINGRGGVFGPDLSDIGRRRGAIHLRTSLIDPHADVPRSFSVYRNDVSLTQNVLQVRLTTRDGRQLTGARVNEDTFTIQLRDPAGKLHSFFKSELAELHKDWGRSPMPSLASAFSSQELDDVAAYMLTLRGR